MPYQKSTKKTKETDKKPLPKPVMRGKMKYTIARGQYTNCFWIYFLVTLVQYSAIIMRSIFSQLLTKYIP